MDPVAPSELPSIFDMFRMPIVTTTKSKTFQPDFQKDQNQNEYLNTWVFDHDD